MADNINTCAITGNLTRDPELKKVSGGSLSVCELGVACNGSKKDQQGNWVEDVNFFDVTVFGGQADACANYLAKGRGVAIQGRLDWQSWEAKDGSGRRSKVVIIADRVQFLGGRQDGDAPAASQNASEGDFSDAPADTSGVGDRPEPSDDDIPF
jgi:single-strand DNA-binding protein